MISSLTKRSKQGGGSQNRYLPYWSQDVNWTSDTGRIHLWYRITRLVNGIDDLERLRYRYTRPRSHNNLFWKIYFLGAGHWVLGKHINLIFRMRAFDADVTFYHSMQGIYCVLVFVLLAEIIRHKCSAISVHGWILYLFCLYFLNRNVVFMLAQTWDLSFNLFFLLN